MSYLVDTDIRYQGPDIIEPFNPAQVQPASYDVRLSRVFMVPRYPLGVDKLLVRVDMHDPSTYDNLYDRRELDEDESFKLNAGEFVLGGTVEVVKIPTNLVCRIEGKSSCGRLGLIVHATAGYVDPGFNGNITLEMANLLRVPIILHPGDLIAQLSFAYTTQAAARPYGHPDLKSRYQGDRETTASRYTA